MNRHGYSTFFQSRTTDPWSASWRSANGLPLLEYDKYILKILEEKLRLKFLWKNNSIAKVFLTKKIKCNRMGVSVILMRVCRTNHVHITIEYPCGISVLCTMQSVGNIINESQVLWLTGISCRTSDRPMIWKIDFPRNSLLCLNHQFK